MKTDYEDEDDAELDAHLMDELIDAMGGRDADALFPKGDGAHSVVEIHIRPGEPPKVASESDEEARREEGMLPKPDELEAMMKRGMSGMR